MIEGDNELQEEIDAEEAEAAAYADENGGGPGAEKEEIRLLRLLENTEREIGRAEDAKKADMDVHNDGIKQLKTSLEGILESITALRLGQRDLPLEE